MKVYVFTIESEEDFGGISILENLVFASMEKAKQYLKELKEQFLSDTGINEDCATIEQDETYFLWYEDGNYSNNHYLLKIQEREIM